MKKFFALLLVGFFGYVSYPLFYPEPPSVSEENNEVSSEAVANSPIKPEEAAVIPDEQVVEAEPEAKKIVSHKMAIKDELPEIVEEPEEELEKEEMVKARELDENDFKIIITKEVESGGRIDFRKDNIISWELREQALSLQGAEYLGEIGIEVGTLFGPELRKVKVVIKDEKITSWEWLAVDEKK